MPNTMETSTKTKNSQKNMSSNHLHLFTKNMGVVVEKIIHEAIYF